MRLHMTPASGWLSLVVLVATALLLAGCEDVAQQCPPLAHPPVLTVAAATNPCQAKAGETAKQLENRVVQKYQRSQPPNPGGPIYPLRCGTNDFGYLHLLDEIKQGHHDHCDPVNDAECQAEIAYALEHGKPFVQRGGNYRYTVQYDDAQSACRNGDWGFRVVIAPNLPVGVLVHLDGLPVGIITAFRLPTDPGS